MNKINHTVHLITAYLLLAMTFIGAINAILRYIGRYFKIALSSNMMIELQWYLFSIIFLLAAGYVYTKDQHIRVDVWYDKMSAKTQKITNSIGDWLLAMPLCIIMLWVASTFFWTSLMQGEQSSDTGGLPRYIIKFFVPFSFLYLTIVILTKRRK